MSLEKVQLITLVTVPESISLLFMNWQNLVPINPLVISHRGPSVSELINRQLDYAVAAKTQHTWIKIVGWCHVTVQVCPGRSLPGIVCPGVVSFYSLFKESSCRAAHDNSLQEGLWLLCIVSIFWTRELIRWFLTFSAWADPLGNIALVSEASDHWQIRAPGLQAGQTLNFSPCLQILPGELLYAGIKTGSAWRVRFGSLLRNGFPQRPQPSASELNRQRAGLFLQPHGLSGALFSHTWAFGVSDTLACPSCCFFSSVLGMTDSCCHTSACCSSWSVLVALEGARRERSSAKARRDASPILVACSVGTLCVTHLKRRDISLWERAASGG